MAQSRSSGQPVTARCAGRTARHLARAGPGPVPQCARPRLVDLWPASRDVPGSPFFHSLRHTTATLLARAKVHSSVAQKILRHANIETTLAIYTHVDGIEDLRAAVAKLDFGLLA